MTDDLIERLRAQTLSTEDAVAPCSIRGDADLINEAADALADHYAYREQRIEEEVQRRCADAEDRRTIISALVDEIATLRAEVEKYSQMAFTLGVQNEGLRDRIAELEAELLEVARDLGRSEDRIAELEAERDAWQVVG